MSRFFIRKGLSQIQSELPMSQNLLRPFNISPPSEPCILSATQPREGSSRQPHLFLSHIQDSGGREEKALCGGLGG